MIRLPVLPERTLPQADQALALLALHLLALLLAATCMLVSRPARAAAMTDGPDPAPRLQLAAAAWPADIVRKADLLLQDSPGDLRAQSEREQAARVMELLRGRDINLFRAAFQTDFGSADRNADLRRAALGDADAALRVAHYLDPAAGNLRNPAERHRYVGWLQLAAKLGSDRAAYELALYFRREGEPVLAAGYETQAIQMGYRPPNALDHSRK